jgi:hypothetical protein
MKFKDLAVDEEFEFDHSDLSVKPLAFEKGPWRKVSPRKYVYAYGRKDYSLRVGSINAKVVSLGRKVGGHG